MTTTRLSSPPAAHAVLDLVRGRVVSGMAVLVVNVASGFFSVPLEKMVVAGAGKLKERQ